MKMRSRRRIKQRIKPKSDSGKRNKAKPVGLFGPEDLFDDCPICQAEKMAMEQGRSLTMLELKEAFKRAKGKGAIVGGDAFEKDE